MRQFLILLLVLTLSGCGTFETSISDVEDSNNEAVSEPEQEEATKALVEDGVIGAICACSQTILVSPELVILTTCDEEEDEFPISDYDSSCLACNNQRALAGCDTECNC